MRQQRRQRITVKCMKVRMLVFISTAAMLLLYNTSDIYRLSSSGSRSLYSSQLESMSLTLGLPSDFREADVLVKLYNFQVKSQLQKEHIQDYKTNIYEERRGHLKKTCATLESKFQDINKNSLRVMWLTFKPQVFYCPVYKSGTTFWSKAIQVMQETDPQITSPFQFFNHYGFLKDITLKDIFPGENMTSHSKEYIDSSLKFLFVRNPYSRVFSVYIDKVLAPNTYFWHWKRTFNLTLHNDSVIVKGKCGPDLTFQEFVTALLEQRDVDKHLKPIYATCDLCTIDYDVIGKLETFDKDVRHVLRKSGTLDRRVKFKNLKYETKVDMILYQIIRAFLTDSAWKECIDKHSAWRRLWRQLQISGFIDKETTYPLSSWESDDIPLTAYINMALEAFKVSTSGAKVNKKEAYLQAYTQLSASDLERLRLMYLPDFQLFGYDDRPKELFELDRESVNSNYDYFDILQK